MHVTRRTFITALAIVTMATAACGTDAAPTDELGATDPVVEVGASDPEAPIIAEDVSAVPPATFESPEPDSPGLDGDPNEPSGPPESSELPVDVMVEESDTPAPPIVVEEADGSSSVIASLPVGPDGVGYSYVNEDPELPVSGPAVIAVSHHGVHVVDLIGRQIVTVDGDERSVIDLAALGIGPVMDLVAKPDRLELLELDHLTLAPRVHHLGFDGAVISTVPVGAEFSLADGLTGLVDTGDERIAIELTFGRSFAQWDPEAAVFEPTDSVVIAGRAVTSAEGDLVVGDDALTVDAVEDAFGSLRYLAHRDGVDVVRREEVMVTGVIEVVSSIEWYDNGALLGTAETGFDQTVEEAIGEVAVGPDGAAYALVTLPDRIDVIRLGRSPARVTM